MCPLKSFRKLNHNQPWIGLSSTPEGQLDLVRGKRPKVIQVIISVLVSKFTATCVKGHTSLSAQLWLVTIRVSG